MHHLSRITLTSSRLKENRTKREVREGNLRSLNLKVILEVERKWSLPCVSGQAWSWWVHVLLVFIGTLKYWRSSVITLIFWSDREVWWTEELLTAGSLRHHSNLLKWLRSVVEEPKYVLCLRVLLKICPAAWTASICFCWSRSWPSKWMSSFSCLAGVLLLVLVYRCFSVANCLLGFY